MAKSDYMPKIVERTIAGVETRIRTLSGIQRDELWQAYAKLPKVKNDKGEDVLSEPSRFHAELVARTICDIYGNAVFESTDEARGCDAQILDALYAAANAVNGIETNAIDAEKKS
jgi:hypothetical protein